MMYVETILRGKHDKKYRRMSARDIAHDVIECLIRSVSLFIPGKALKFQMLLKIVLKTSVLEFLRKQNLINSM